MTTPRRFDVSSQTEFNIQLYLDREFVNSGFYFTVPSGAVDVDGQREDVLTRVNSNLYESFTDRWIGDTDATGVPGFPTIDPSGVSIDGVFHPKGAAPFIPTFDFQGGRVIFEGSGISDASAEVSVPGFSYKQVVVDFPDTEIVNLLFNQIRDNVDFTPHLFPSGNQRQLPAVVIDLQDSFMSGAELGGGKNKNQLVVLHILSTDRIEMNRINDFLQQVQTQKTIKGVDFNVAPQRFTVNGDRASTYVSYTDMQASGSLAWRKLYIDQARVRERVFDAKLKRVRLDWTVLALFLPPDGG